MSKQNFSFSCLINTIMFLNFSRIIEAVIVKLLVQSFEKNLGVLWKFIIKNLKFITLHPFLKISKRNLKIHIDSEKSINSF